MENPIQAGAIAGLVGGVVGFFCMNIFPAIFPTIEIFKLLGSYPSLFDVVIVLSAVLVLNMVWGGIQGIIFSRFYNRILGKGVSKGLVFGLLIFLIVDAHPVSFLIALSKYEYLIRAVFQYAFYGFFVQISYGSVLGALYKKN
jgi:hypothetical protein